MTVMAVGLLLIVAGFLIVSAVAKAIHPSAAATALAELGVPHPAARVSVFSGVGVEICVAAAIVVWPRALEARLACVALFAAFALLAGLALGAGRAIECGCFGSLHRSRLGAIQILQLAVVIPLMIVVGRDGPGWTPQTGLAVLLVVVVGVSAVLLAHAIPVWWQIRRDRSSLGRVQEYLGRARRQDASVPAAAEPT